MVAFSGLLASAQMTDLPVSASQTTIVSGQNVQISTTGSQIGYQYALRDNSDNSFVDGPVQGTGNDLIFNTGAITADKSYNVYGTNGFAATFSYGNDRINLSNSERDIDKEVTVAAWIKTASSSGIRNIVLDYGADDAGYILRVDANGRVAFSGRDGTGNFKTSGISSVVVTDNQWHYIVGAANLNTGDWGIMVDGVPQSLQNNGVGNSFINTDALNIGSPFSTSASFVGQIKDVTIWNRVLDGQEMVDNMTACLTGLESGVVAHYPLSEGVGTEVIDHSLFEITGTISSGTSPWVGNTGNCRYELEMSQIIDITVGPGSGIFVDSINVEGFAGSNSIITDGGTLQMVAEVFPVNADDDTYTWSVVNGTGSASIAGNGMLTAITNGTVDVIATANDGSGIIGTTEIILINQAPVLVNSISVQGQGGASTITANAGTLQMEATVLPANADNATYIWSVVNGTGSANIDANGLLTALTNGTVDVIATANDGSGVTGMTTITISNQNVGINEITLKDIKIYPNPVQNELFIDGLNGQINQLEIIDYSGRIITSISEKNIKSIDVSGINQGIYILKISTDKGTSTKQFIKK